MEWLKTELKNSTAKWKVLGQQVMMGNLKLFWQNGNGVILNNDRWDGYEVDRKSYTTSFWTITLKMYCFNGDIHTAWAMVTV